MVGCRTVKAIRGITGLLLALIASKDVAAFMQPPDRFQNKQSHTLRFFSDSSTPYNPDLISKHDMEELIMSLCSDADDASRRGKLSKLIEENLRSQDGGDTFIKLFDQVLIVVGDRMRLEASDSSSQTTQNDVNDNSDETTSALPSFPLPAQRKSSSEGQLWACIDMMVQSKILVKKARVNIVGNEGVNEHSQ